MTARKLVAAFERWRSSGEALVLASVYETSGSTYSKAGAQILIAANGDFQGMLSGGCLEGDLGERARQVLATGQAQSVTYDLGQNDEELWGLGVGCDGLMRVFLQPLKAEEDYQPFAAMAAAFDSDKPEIAVTVIDSAHPDIVNGSCLVTRDGEIAYESIGETNIRQFPDVAVDASDRRASAAYTMEIDGADVLILSTLLQPSPRILVLGAGLDAQPVVRFIDEMGWRATVQDHRPAYIDSGDFSTAEQVLCVPASELADALDLDQYDAAVVMSHHLTTDRIYLGLLAESSIANIGLLGPPDRHRRLMDELDQVAAKLQGRVQGPAGIDIGGRGPAAIALSIVAQIQLDLVKQGAAR